MHRGRSLSGIVLALGIASTLLGYFAADRFEQEHRFRSVHDQAERLLRHLEERLADYETVVRASHHYAELSLSAPILPQKLDLTPRGHHPGLKRVALLPQGCRSQGVPADLPPEWGALAETGGAPEFRWQLAVFQPGRPLDTPEQRRVACLGIVAASFDPQLWFADLFEHPDVAGLSIRQVSLIRRDGNSTRLESLYGPRGPGGIIMARDEMRIGGNEVLVELAAPEDSVLLWGRLVLGGGLLLSFSLYNLIRSRYERRLADAERELERYGRVAAMGELAAAIGHELAQPLTGVLGCLEAETLRTPSADGSNLAKALRHAERAAAIVADVRRQATAPSGGEVEAVELGLAVERAMDLARLDPVFRGRALSLELPAGEVRASASPIGLECVLLNLLRNSAEALATAGPGGHIWVAVVAAGTAVLVRVIDDGPGIPDPDRLFRPFRSRKPGGMGLGLCFCRRSVESWGGRLTGANRAEGGAVFELELEARKASPPAPPG